MCKCPLHLPQCHDSFKPMSPVAFYLHLYEKSLYVVFSPCLSVTLILFFDDLKFSYILVQGSDSCDRLRARRLYLPRKGTCGEKGQFQQQPCPEYPLFGSVLCRHGKDVNFISNNFQKPCVMLVKVGPSKTTPPVCIGCGRSVSGTVRSEKESESTKRSKQDQAIK